MIVVVLAAALVLVLKLSPEIFPVEVGSSAPAFTATDLKTGQSATLADYKGQVVLLNVWATWCEPCKIEMPSMEQMEKELGPQGLKIVAVSIDEGGPDAVRQFAQDYGLTFRILQDPIRTHPADLPDDRRARELRDQPAGEDRQEGHRRHRLGRHRQQGPVRRLLAQQG